VTTLVIPDGVTTIGMNTFYGYTDLVDVIIPESVTAIDNYAFDKCTSLETVYYKEELEKWKNIKIRSSGNTYLLNADLISIKEPYLAGDINVDGAVNATDITLLKKCLLEGNTNYLCDVNKDSNTDIRDLVRLKIILVEKR
jgi:hypothetical protein